MSEMAEEPSDVESFLLWADLLIAQYGANSPEVEQLMRQAQRERKKKPRARPNASQN
jgi:hypothetical protein